MPFDQQPPRWNPGQRINARDLNALSDILRTLQQYFGDNFTQNYSTEPQFLLGGFSAIVRGDSGYPEFKAGYTDGIRTYADVACPDPITDTDPFQASADTFTGLYPNGSTVITASNIANVALGGGPMPAPGTPILVFQLINRGNYNPASGQYGNPSTNLNVFWWTTPGTSDVIATVNDDPSTGDESGIYKDAVRDTGETTGMPTDGMTVPTVSDTVIANLAEYKLNNKTGADFAHSHWIEPGRTVFGVENGSMVVEGDTRPIVVASLPNPYAAFEVYLVKDGYYGTAGSVSWTYTVTDLLGKKLGTHVPAPLFDDPSSVPKWWQSFPSYNGALHALCYYDENGNLQIGPTDSVPVAGLFEVDITGHTGANAGSGNANATYQYNCADLNGNVLTVSSGAQSPAWGRPQGMLTGPATHGAGYFTIGGVFVLAFTDEQAVTLGTTFLVTLNEDGGTNGDGTAATDASYTYTAISLASVTLGTSLMPLFARPRGLLVGPATNGLGAYNASGNFVLVTTDERMQIAACSS